MQCKIVTFTSSRMMFIKLNYVNFYLKCMYRQNGRFSPEAVHASIALKCAHECLVSGAVYVQHEARQLLYIKFCRSNSFIH